MTWTRRGGGWYPDVETTYAHFFGRSPTAEWSGFQVTKGMTKVGQAARFNFSTWMYPGWNDHDFRVLSMDATLNWNSTHRVRHRAYGKHYDLDTHSWLWLDMSNALPVDFNYSKDDGSVHAMREAFRGDTDRIVNTGSNCNKGWYLPAQ